MTLSEGDIAPQFSLPSHHGETMSLDELKGKMIVLYFYPKDDTPGCTKQAIGFSEKLDAFHEAGAIVIGVSPDKVAKHEKFVAKHDLTVTLLADEEQKALNDYGVWVEKSMYGKKYMGVERTTFLIDETGKIVKIWRKVKVPGHVEAVLEAVEAA